MAKPKTTDDGRVPLDEKQKRRHMEVLTKNMLRKRELRADLKKIDAAIELCMADLEAGGFRPAAQGELELPEDQARA